MSEFGHHKEPWVPETKIEMKGKELGMPPRPYTPTKATEVMNEIVREFKTFERTGRSLAAKLYDFAERRGWEVLRNDDGQVYRSLKACLAHRLRVTERQARRLIQEGRARHNLLLDDEVGPHVEHISGNALRQIDNQPEEVQIEVARRAMTRASARADKRFLVNEVDVKEAIREHNQSVPEPDPVPSKVEMAMKTGAALRVVGRELTACRKTIEQLMSRPGGELLRQSDIAHLFDGLGKALKFKPWAYCPQCEGQGCDYCNHRGWVTALMLSEWKRAQEGEAE